jgi:quaternary ammonium compound-resistance protein SugE
MRDIPVGTAYTVFTGVGAAGAVALGIAIYGDPITLKRLAGIALIVGGAMVLQR